MMRKFIHKLLLFSLLALCLLAPADYVYSERIKKSNHFAIESWYDLMRGDIDAEVVVMGSSRAWVHVDPLMVDSILQTTSYNLGMDGSFINRQVQKYNLFRRYNAKPKLIIQTIDHISLKYRVGYERDQYFPYFWDNAMRKEVLDTEPFTFAEKYLPMYRYVANFDRETLMERIKNTERRLTKGYKGQEASWDGTEFRKVKEIKFEVNDTTLRMFHKYLSQTKKEDIKVVFVYAPLYTGATKKITNIDEMYRTYSDIAKKYNIPIIDLMNMGISSDTAYFYNAMHLNRRGAEIYTDSLCHEIKRRGIYPNHCFHNMTQ